MEGINRLLVGREYGTGGRKPAALAGFNGHFIRRLAPTELPEGHRGVVNDLAWGHAGTVILSAGDDCKLRIWHVNKPALRHVYDPVSGAGDAIGEGAGQPHAPSPS